MKEQILTWALGIAGTFAASAFGVAMLWLRKKLHVDTLAQSTNLGDQWLARIANLSFMTVQNVESTLRPKIVEFMQDGKISPEEAQKLKQYAITSVLQDLTEEGQKAAQDALNLGFDQLKGLIGKQVETQLAEVQRKNAIAEGVSGTPMTRSLGDVMPVVAEDRFRGPDDQG